MKCKRSVFIILPRLEISLNIEYGVSRCFPLSRYPLSSYVLVVAKSSSLRTVIIVELICWHCNTGPGILIWYEKFPFVGWVKSRIFDLNKIDLAIHAGPWCDPLVNSLVDIPVSELSSADILVFKKAFTQIISATCHASGASNIRKADSTVIHPI